MASAGEVGAGMIGSQDKFLYTDSALNALDSSISPDRLGTCLKVAGFNRSRASQMYIWNARLSECFYFPLQCAEITLRNAIHDAFSDAYSPDWPIDIKFERHVGAKTIANIAKVQTRITEAGHPIITPRIVAGMSFDFWTILLTGKFNKPVWQTRLHRTFPNLPKTSHRRDLATLAIGLRDFRNRVMHHEPILRVNHSDMQRDILQLIRYRCDQTADWVRHHSRVHIILRERPR
jgi:hypothetical protein